MSFFTPRSATPNSRGATVAPTPSGHAVQIVTVSPDRKFHLDVAALSSILLKDAVRHRPVVVLSIAGDFRKGKSFLLNHVLRYLQAGNDEAAKAAVFSQANLDRPLTGGFHWRGGAERDTTGMLMWSEPFIIKIPASKKPAAGGGTLKQKSSSSSEVAILLLDTQGAFDSEYTLKHSATVFALCTLVSSQLVFNLRHNLQEDNLNVLDAFTDYGRLVKEATPELANQQSAAPFQRLLFLIRDWSYPYEYPYGLEGGTRLLADNLAMKPTMPEQLQRVRRRVLDCFEELQCFLLPHPGSTVAASPAFDGRLRDYDPAFLRSLEELVHLLLAPERLQAKRIGGRRLTGSDLLAYFKVYAGLLEGDSMPEPKTMLEATAEVNNLTAVSAVQDVYTERLEKMAGARAPYIRPSLLAERVARLQADCLAAFDALPKMGGGDFSRPYRERLQDSMRRLFEQYEELNSRKNLFTQIGVPLLLLFTAIGLNLLSRLSEAVLAFRLLAALLQLAAYLVAGLLAGYVFARFSGCWARYILAVETLTEVAVSRLAQYVLKKVLHSVVLEGAQEGGGEGGRGGGGGGSSIRQQLMIDGNSPTGSSRGRLLQQQRITADVAAGSQRRRTGTIRTNRNSLRVKLPPAN